MSSSCMTQDTNHKLTKSSYSPQNRKLPELFKISVGFQHLENLIVNINVQSSLLNVKYRSTKYTIHNTYMSLKMSIFIFNIHIPSPTTFISSLKIVWIYQSKNHFYLFLLPASTGGHSRSGDVSAGEGDNTTLQHSAAHCVPPKPSPPHSPTWLCISYHQLQHSVDHVLEDGESAQHLEPDHSISSARTKLRRVPRVQRGEDLR